MTIFYCVRHGKTEFNQNQTFQGGMADSPLLPEGIKSAQLVGNYLKEIPFDAAFVSPQKRAQDTAKLILTEHLSLAEFDTLTDLREMEFGVWDGKPEADYHHEEQFQHLVHRPHLYDPADIGGESFATVIERGTAVFHQLAKDYPDGKILVVSHGLFLQTILKTFQGIPLAEIRQGAFLDNTSVSTIVTTAIPGELKIETWNDTSFVK